MIPPDYFDRSLQLLAVWAYHEFGEDVPPQEALDLYMEEENEVINQYDIEINPERRRTERTGPHTGVLADEVQTIVTMWSRAE